MPIRSIHFVWAVASLQPGSAYAHLFVHGSSPCFSILPPLINTVNIAKSRLDHGSNLTLYIEWVFLVNSLHVSIHKHSRNNFWFCHKQNVTEKRKTQRWNHSKMHFYSKILTFVRIFNNRYLGEKIHTATRVTITLHGETSSFLTISLYRQGTPHIRRRWFCKIQWMNCFHEKVRDTRNNSRFS